MDSDAQVNGRYKEWMAEEVGVMTFDERRERRHF